MSLTHPAYAARALAARLAYRLAIPAVALLGFAVLAGLRQWGPHDLYFQVLKLLGFEPFRFPFLDIHAVLAAAQCQRQGIDVYLTNPCDALDRVHVYSPLWLALTPGFLGTSATAAVGLGLDLMFILSLAAVIRPATAGETLVLGLVALSPMTVYALERANNDLVIFLVILAGCSLDRTSRPWRLGCYALYLTAGLLKYYPLVLLVLLARERRRQAQAVAGVVGAIVVLLLIRGHADFAKALPNIPTLSYFADSFSARNLPFGFAEAVGGLRWRSVIGVSLLVILIAIAFARMRRTVQLLEASVPDRIGWESHCLLVGALLVTACFLAGQNVDYRGIYFVLVAPGLIRLHRTARDNGLRKFLARMVAAVLFVACGPCFRHAFYAMTAELPSDGARQRAELLFWIGRELVWWWLIAGLAAIVLCEVRHMPLVRGCGGAGDHLPRTGERAQQVRG
jgi:Glycosyltransferase family 87